MAPRLTTKGVEAVKPDPTKRLEIPDAAMRGLYLVVQPSGAKSWAARFRHLGKPVKMTLGKWPLMGLADARARAAEAIEQAEHGVNPAEVQKAQKAAVAEPDRDTVREVIKLFMKRHARHNRRADDVAAMFQREVMEKWGNRPIQSISKRDVIEVLDAIVDRGSPVSANRLRAHLNTLFNWAKGRDVLTENPLDGIKPPAPEKPRDRVLTDDEIRLFWGACDKIGQPFGPLFQIMLLTGQRRGEVAGMSDREIKDSIWTISAARSKNGDEHTVPLSESVQTILATVIRIKGSAGLIFTTNGDTAVSGFTRARSRLVEEVRKLAEDEELAVDYTLHDLRRTAATGMAGLRFPPHIVEAVLNHRSGTRRGVAGVYNRFDYADEKRAALDAWARYVAELIEGKADNVVPLIAVGEAR